jgi:site-specific DNA-cytosine methylase
MLLDSRVLNPQVNEVCVGGSGKFQYFEDKKTIEFVIGTIQVDSIKEVMSNSALYKQAGNSICVPTVQYIIEELFKCGVLNDSKVHNFNSY